MNTQTQFIKRPEQRDEWLRARSGFVGFSEAAIIEGLSPWKSPVDLWLLKSGRKPVEDEPTEAQRLGIYLEQYAADRYTEKTGLSVRNYGYMVTRGHALADVDRLIVPEGQKIASFHEEVRTRGILECKTARDEWDGEVPLYYQVQAQGYMELLDCDFVDFSVVFKGNSKHLCPADADWLRVTRDRRVGAKLCEDIEAFWRCVAEDTPPPAVSLADVRALYPNAKPETPKDATAEVARAVERLRAIKAQTDELDEEAEGLRGAVAAFMGEADTLRVGGAKAVTFKAPKPSLATDWKAVSAACKGVSAFDEAVAANTKPREASRRFLLCGAK